MGQYSAKLVNYLKKNENKNNSSIKLAYFDGQYFNCGALQLEKDDVMVPDYLKTGYVKEVVDNQAERVEGLTTGDTVAIVRLSDEMYLVLERMVEL